jgi:hypothetical protein
MHRDFIEFVEILNRNNVEFVIIGGIALAYYGFPRFTGDIDFWIRPSAHNAQKTFNSIEEFFSMRISTTADEFLSGNKMISLGEEPVKIEIHTRLDGITENEIWNTRERGKFGDEEVFYIGKEAFIKNKKAVGRDQDLVDIKNIESQKDE